MRAASIPARTAPTAVLRSRRLLALAGDARLVEQIQRGNDAAFEVMFERHGAAILGFCRHMLGSPEEAEDAVQHTFAAAYRDLQRGGEREIALKPWLFAIARNRCLSVLRARRDVPAEVDALESELPSAAGLAEQVEERAELRRLLADVRELPDEQRAALLLTELGDLSHREVADVVGCEVARVKALVFRARSALIARREARETPCESIRMQLANLRGGALRRTELRLHLRECPGCRAYRERVKEQRRMLAAALPVVPTLGLKSSVLAAIGIGGGGSAGGLTAAGSLGGATLAKVAAAGVLAGGGLVAGGAVVNWDREAVAPAGPAQAADRNAAPAARGDGSSAAGGSSAEPRDGSPALRRGVSPVPGRGAGGAAGRRTGGGAPAGAERGTAGRLDPDRAARARGRGPIDAPPASTPVRRGPPDKTWKSEPRENAGPRGLAKGHANPNGGSRATGAPKPNAGAKADTKPPRIRARGTSVNANGRPKPSARRKTSARTKPSAPAKPNVNGNPLAGAIARPDTPLPTGTRPDPASQP